MALVTEARSVVASARAPGNRVYAAGIAVALVIRLAWAAAVAKPPTQPFNDASIYLSMAHGFLHGDLPRFFGGHPTAFFGPGYPLIIAPMVWIGQVTGLFGAAMAAAIVNALFGTATVAIAGQLSSEWIRPAARNPTTWILALCPGQIYLTSTGQTETVLTTFILLMMLLTVRLQKKHNGVPPMRSVAAIGILAGAAILIHSTAMFCLVVPMLTLRALQGSWRGAVRITAITLLGAMVFLAPWTIRNGLQVGIWTPLSTREATAICLSRAGSANLARLDGTLARQCYRNSPYDDPSLHVAPPKGFEFSHPDEAVWYRRTSAESMRWFLGHPGSLTTHIVRNTWRSWTGEWDAVPAARDWQDSNWAGWLGFPLEGLANAWLWGAYLLAAIAWFEFPKCRRALPLWGFVAAQAFVLMFTVANPHFRFSSVPIIAIYAGNGIVAWREWKPPSARRREARSGHPSSRPKHGHGHGRGQQLRPTSPSEG